jgi:hypothetical protein
MRDHHNKSTVGRRGFLAALGAIAVAAAVRPASAATPPMSTRVAKVESGEKGVTLYLELDSAPNSAHPTVIVYVPKHFRYSASKRVALLVHFHGIMSSAEEAMTGNQLREQLFDSKQNAILIVPQGGMHSSDVSFGKLEEQGGLKRMLRETLHVLTTRDARRALGHSAITAGARPGLVCLSTHSGGYHGVAACLTRGEVEVTEVYLFDALYADTDVFKEWVIAGKGRAPRRRHKLVNYYPGAGTTATQSRYLKGELEKAGVKVAEERSEGTMTRADMTHDEAVFVQTSLSHGDVTWESNALRDSLFASAMPRLMASSWFHDSHAARRIDVRH